MCLLYNNNVYIKQYLYMRCIFVCIRDIICTHIYIYLIFFPKNNLLYKNCTFCVILENLMVPILITHQSILTYNLIG